MSYFLKVYQPTKTKEQSEQCEGEITENEVKNALGNMVCNKIHGHTSEFYEAFRSELKTPLLLSYKKSFLSGEFLKTSSC